MTMRDRTDDVATAWVARTEVAAVDASEAMAAAYHAYRDTSRLIRLLTVVGQPCPPGELVEQSLVVLSEAFAAAVTFLGHVVGDRLLVASSCGLPEGDRAYSDGWPVGEGVVEALSTGGVVVRRLTDPAEVPPA